MAERRHTLYRNTSRSLLLVSLAAALVAGTAHAQHAQETAGQRIRLKAFGMFSYVRPDYNFGTKNLGGTLGADVDGFRLLPHTELGLDARMTYSSGTVSNQLYFGGGPRVSLNAGAFKPYGDFIFGHGTSYFNNSGDPTYTQDRTGAISYGGGFDYQLSRAWAVRADLQRERWRFSTNTPFFYPVAISVGASYQIHLHSRTGPNL